MRKFFILLAIMASAFVAAARSDSPLVYVLPLDDEIGSTTWHHTRRAIEEAHRAKASLLLVHLNTYGGVVLHADSIRTALMHCGIPTVAFVDNNAASAGALIALACDSVYMTPDATMGAVTVVNGADGQAMPDKYQSYMRAMMRATAEKHGKVAGPDSVMHWRRDPLIAEAMVDPRVKVPGLIDDTRVLTFTSEEAQKWGYSDGKAEHMADVLHALGIKDYRIERFEPTWVDALMGFFTNPAVQAVLIMIIVAGIYFELQTPGMGFPTLAAVMAAALYFLPLYLTGITASWVILVFLLGLLLLLLELLVIPGFGVAGISGIVLMAGAIFIGLFDNFTIEPIGFDGNAMWSALGILAAAVALSVALILFLTSRYAPASVRRHSQLTLTQQVEDGYIGVDLGPTRHIGHLAVAVTPLRPSGTVEIDGEPFDAVSRGSFISKGTAVKVVDYHNAQLIVIPND